MNQTAPVQKTRVPMALTRTRLIMLFRLWAAGYDKGLYAQGSEHHAANELCRLGYAAQDPSCKTHYRITAEGADRLEAPMRLYQQARSHLRVVK